MAYSFSFQIEHKNIDLLDITKKLQAISSQIRLHNKNQKQSKSNSIEYSQNNTKTNELATTSNVPPR